jgi:uncharacterized phage infection (PIP) family protein YhgE
MEDYLRSMRSHIDEAAAAGANLMREANAYADKIKALKPVADQLEAVAKQVQDKQAELVTITDKLKEAHVLRANALKTLQD